MDADEAVGKRIEDLRTSRDLSQGELSDLLRAAGLNWSQGTVSRVEAGTRPVRFTEAFTVAKTLGVEALALAPAGTGLRYAFQQDLDAIATESRYLLEREGRLNQAIAMSQMVRFAIELSEGRQGPYVVHTSLPVLTRGLANHLRMSPEGVMELIGVPQTAVADQVTRADDDFRSIEESGLDLEWDGPDYAPNLGEWIRDRIDRDDLDPYRPGSRGWKFLLRQLHDNLRFAAITCLWNRYFPFVTEAPGTANPGAAPFTNPTVEGIDVTDIDAQTTSLGPHLRASLMNH